MTRRDRDPNADIHILMKTRFHQHALGASTTHAVACLALWLGAWLASPLAAQDTPEAAPVPPVVEQTGMEATDTPVEAAVPADDGAAAIEEAAPETPPVEAIEAPPPPAPPPVNRRELVTIGGDAHLLSNETSQEMVTILGNAIVDGHVQGECVTILGNVTVNGRVDGELVCILGQVTLGPHAEIHGEVIAVGGRIDSAPGAVIHGERVELPFLGGASLPSFEWLGQWITEGVMLGRPLPHRQLWAWVAAGVLLLINLLFYVIFRRPVETSASALDRKPAMAFVNGVLFFILFGPLVFLLLISVVGILILPFLVAGAFLAGLGGLISVYRFSGGQLGLNAHPMPALIIGNVLFTLLYAVPFVGFAVFAMAGLLGLGSVVTALIESMKREARGSGPKRFPASPPTGIPSQVASAPMAAQTQGNPVAANHSAASTESVAGAPGTGPATQVPAPTPQPQGSTPSTMVYLERVGFWPRLGATALDFLLIAGLTGFLDMQFLFPYIWLAYHIAFWSWRATTIGGIVLNLRIDRLDGRKVDLGVASVRSLGSIFSGMILGLGFMWASWDEERQSWHDKIAGTTIVRVPRGQSLL